MRRQLVGLCLLAGCGRYGFGWSDDPSRDASSVGDSRLDDGALDDGALGDGSVTSAIRYRMDNDPSTGSIPATMAAYSATCTLCPTAAAGHLGGAYHFDGNQRFFLPNNTLVGIEPYTVAVRVFAATTATNMSAVSKPYDTTSNRDVFSLIVRRTDVIASCSKGPTRRVTRPTCRRRTRSPSLNVAPPGRPPGMASTKRLYIDGVLSDSQTTTAVDSTFSIEVGADRDANTVASHIGTRRARVLPPRSTPARSLRSPPNSVRFAAARSVDRCASTPSSRRAGSIQPWKPRRSSRLAASADRAPELHVTTIASSRSSPRSARCASR